MIIYQIRLPKKQDAEAFVKAHGIRTCSQRICGTSSLTPRHWTAILTVDRERVNSYQ
jgi:hypothetical protein